MIRLSTFLSTFARRYENNSISQYSVLKCNDILKLELPRMEHFEQWRKIRFENKAFLQPWEPTWPFDVLTEKSFEYRVKQASENAKLKSGYTYLITHKEAGVIGGISLYNIRLGSAMSGTVGYWLAQNFNGRGHMSAALNRICQFGFNTQKLKRIESACLPSNIRSIKLLESAEFCQEGLAKSYLEINGRRCDHILFSKIAI